MDGTSYSTPLIALNAVVLDTETTGLDARVARVVQIGALRLSGGSLQAGERFESLVKPGSAIPKTAVAVHGITDAMVDAAPAFAGIAPALEAFVGRAIVIGHAINYDLAVLEREYALARRPWPRFRALDVRALARLAIFSAEDDVRAAAIDALKVRREKDYTDILVKGLRYPWPAVAKRAADAIKRAWKSVMRCRLSSAMCSSSPSSI